MEALDAFLGLPEGSLALLPLRNTPGNEKQAYLTRLARNNDVLCFQETHGKDELLQAIQVLVPQFRMFGASTPNNVNAGRSAILIRKNPVVRRCDYYSLCHLPRA